MQTQRLIQLYLCMFVMPLYCSEKLPTISSKDSEKSQTDVGIKREEAGKYKVRTMTRSKPKSEEGGIFSPRDWGPVQKTS